MIINVLFFFATYVLDKQLNFDLVRHLALFFPKSENFEPYQLVTHMFMHGGLTHIFFNMYALWMFGTAIETAWGGKRFLFYYLFTGLGAAALHLLVLYFDYLRVASEMSAGQVELVMSEGASALRQGRNFIDPLMGKLNLLINTPTVGASGAVFGLLLAFGMMYPDARLMLLIPPIPVKAKWFVLGYGVIELVLGVSQPGSSIAHFAHVGGMLFGYILIRYWIRQAKRRSR